MSVEKGQVIYEYNLAGMMVAIHHVYVINPRHKTFTLERAGEVRLHIKPEKDGRLVQANKSRGKKKGVYYIECNKTKRDKLMMALRVKLIDYIEHCNDSKELQKLYATAKKIGTEAKAGNSEETGKDDPDGVGDLPAGDNNDNAKQKSRI